MKEGDVIDTPVGKLELVEYLKYEPSAYIWEDGWLAVEEGQTDEFPVYFLGISGGISKEENTPEENKWVEVGRHDLTDGVWWKD